MKEWVAIILAITILLSLVGTIAVQYLLASDNVQQPMGEAAIAAIRDIIFVIVGALAGFIGGKNATKNGEK